MTTKYHGIGILDSSKSQVFTLRSFRKCEHIHFLGKDWFYNYR